MSTVRLSVCLSVCQPRACSYAQMFVRTCVRSSMHANISDLPPHARAHSHTRTLACLHAHTMHSGTYARTDRHTHPCSYKHPSTNMEVINVVVVVDDDNAFDYVVVLH